MILLFGAEFEQHEFVVVAVAKIPGPDDKWKDEERKLRLGVLKKAIYRVERGCHWVLVALLDDA